MKKNHRIAIQSAILLAFHALAPAVQAHPLGNFTINHYAGLHLSRDEISVEYILDMAEIPAFQEIAGLDTDGNGQPDGAETAGYETARCTDISPDLALTLNGRSAPLELVSAALEFPPGVGGLPTLRLTCSFRTSLATNEKNIDVLFKNNAYAERIGWREIVISSEGLALQGDLADMQQSLSQRLTVYPEDLLTNPLDQSEVSFRLSLTEPATQPGAQPALEQLNPPAGERSDNSSFAALGQMFRLPLLLTAIVAALFWGLHLARVKRQGRS